MGHKTSSNIMVYFTDKEMVKEKTFSLTIDVATSLGRAIV